MWPKIAREIVDHDDHGDASVFPGLAESGFTDALALLDRKARERVTNQAFSQLWASAEAVASPGADAGGPSAVAAVTAAAAAVSSSVANEFNQLVPIVRQNVDQGISGWANVRSRLFAKFGASGDPHTAIARINAYYGQFVPVNFPPAPSSTTG